MEYLKRKINKLGSMDMHGIMHMQSMFFSKHIGNTYMLGYKVSRERVDVPQFIC